MPFLAQKIMIIIRVSIWASSIERKCDIFFSISTSVKISLFKVFCTVDPLAEHLLLRETVVERTHKHTHTDVQMKATFAGKVRTGVETGRQWQHIRGLDATHSYLKLNVQVFNMPHAIAMTPVSPWPTDPRNPAAQYSPFIACTYIIHGISIACNSPSVCRERSKEYRGDETRRAQQKCQRRGKATAAGKCEKTNINFINK